MKDVIEEKVEKILSKMTLKEKIGQMQQISFNAVPAEVFDGMKKTGIIGSYLHVLGSETSAFDESVQKSRLHIPPLFGIDAIHGHALLKGATVFPSQLALACSFDDDLLEEVGCVTAAEVAADGLDWVFSPVLCLARDLRWGRVDETFGEDFKITVEDRYEPDDKEYFQNLETQIASGSAADIFYVSPKYVKSYAATGSVLDLTTYVNWDNYNPNGMWSQSLGAYAYDTVNNTIGDPVTYDASSKTFKTEAGKTAGLYALPKDFSSFGLAYNRNFFTQPLRDALDESGRNRDLVQFEENYAKWQPVKHDAA